MHLSLASGVGFVTDPSNVPFRCITIAFKCYRHMLGRDWIYVLYGYNMDVNPQPFASSNFSIFKKIDNSTVRANEKGQQTQLRAFHPVHNLFINSNVRGTKSTVIGPSHEFLHYFFSRSQAHRLTGLRSQACQIATLGCEGVKV